MAQNPKRILLGGSFRRENFERSWLEWLQDHEFDVQPFNQHAFLDKYIPSRRLQSVLWHVFQPLPVTILSREFTRAACAFQPDLVLMVSGRYISAAALEKVRERTKATLYHFYCEDFFNPLNTTATLRKSASHYDHFFTSKTHNIPELEQMGIHNASLITLGYGPKCHFPVEVSQADKERYGSELAFVGTWEADRAAMLAQLTEFDLRIWGEYWHKAGNSPGLRRAIQNRPVYCEEMSRVFNASKINLGFLRKANRDRQTTRTFEIPACGGFQLSERTEEILGYFVEGKEIECFETLDELKDKARYYLSHETTRQQIANAGLARVRNSPYSHYDAIQKIMEQYLQQRN